MLIDSAIVGNLGTSQLAGLTLASTILVTLVSVFVFLAYATTAAVARQVGAGDTRRALALGLDGMWLAFFLGLIVTTIGLIAAPKLIGAMGGSGDVASYGVDYLRYSIPGMPGMFVVLAATGALRGWHDTKTPFYVAVAGAVVNTAGSFALVYPAGMGIGGSGLATAITQTGMGAFLAWKVAKGLRERQISLRPQIGGILGNLRSGIPLFVRTLTLRAAILITVYVATSMGEITLAAHQIINSMWGFAAFILDALAIAAQALVGHALGAGDHARVRLILRRTLMWSTTLGVGIGVIFATTAGLITPLFNPDPLVQEAAMWGLIVIAIAMPIAGWVYILDGILIGAGDGRYLAWAGVVTLIAYVPPAWVVWRFVSPATAPGIAGSWTDTITTGPASGVVWLWISFSFGFMVARAVMNGIRARGDTWMR